MHEESENQIPLLKGLVLAGGDSSRMGFDKGLINYHGIPQQEYIYDLLVPVTVETFISRKKDQVEQQSRQILEDQFTGLGPFGGILTAFTYDLTCAWLIVACDFPLLNPATIKQLIEARDVNSLATSFLDERSLMPEPWITILEPAIYPVLLQYYKNGRSSLRGVLVDYNTAVVRIEDADALLNANTPEEAERLKQKIYS